LGIGDWGLGIGDWAQSPNPQIFNKYKYKKFLFKKKLKNLKYKIIL
jgi:hypothetical protein